MKEKEYLVFEDQASPETHIFAGMWRPPFHKDLLKQIPDHIPIFDPISQLQISVVREWWIRGEFDKPLYKKIV